MVLTFTSHGGAGTVTGSRHLLERGGRRILVDCGLFQGLKQLRERNWAPFPVDPASIDGVVLTHAHLDHSGYLPKLVREGYKGPIYCSAATADLCEILWKDSAHIAERDAEYANRKGYSRHKPALPLYSMANAERALAQLQPAPFNTGAALPGGASLKLRRAGHILGAAIAEIEWGPRIVFSGDLGRYGDPFMHDPEAIKAADYVVMESTYGDRVHPKNNPMLALGDVIDRTVKRGGTVIIPAFAVGRAQLLLHYLWKLKAAGRLGPVPAFLDSPMAINATELLCRHFEDHRFTAEECDAACGIATYVREVEDSKALSANPMPKVIVSASGMATGGRVLHHIKAFGPDAKNTILFAGYQAAGTRGAKLLDGAAEVKMFGQWTPIRAEIASLPELSAHADADELLRWLGGFEAPPRRTFVVHGESKASEALRERIGRSLKWKCDVVDQGRRYELA